VCVYIYIYIYICVCVCVCVYTHTHTHTHTKVRTKCSFLMLYRVAYSDINLQRGSEEIKCLLSLATITIQAVYPRIIQVPLAQVTFFYSPPPPKKAKKWQLRTLLAAAIWMGVTSGLKWSSTLLHIASYVTNYVILSLSVPWWFNNGCSCCLD